MSSETGAADSGDTETPGSFGRSKVELADMYGDDLAQPADVVVSDRLIETIGFRSEVENR